MTKPKTSFVPNKSITLVEMNSEAVTLSSDGSLPTELLLIPSGRILGRDGRNWKMADVEAVVKNTERHQNPSGGNAIDIVFDYEHQTHLNVEAPAAGWIKNLVAKADGLWAIGIEWTARAAEYIKNKEYRFFSPVFRADTSGNVFRLVSVGLTNLPNIEVQAFNKEDQTVNYEELVAKLRQLLGLADTAVVDDVLKAIEGLNAAVQAQDALNKVSTAVGAVKSTAEDILEAFNKQKFNPTTHVELEKFVAVNKELADLKAKMSEGEAETAVNKAVSDGILPPALKTNALEIFKKMGKAAFEDFVGKMPKLALNKETAHAGAPAPVKTDGKLSDEEIAMCKQIGITEAHYLAAKKQENE